MISGTQRPGSTGRPGGNFLNDINRREEVQKLAQTAGASQFVSTSLPQPPHNGSSSTPLDTAKLSVEAMEEISATPSAEQLRRSDQRVAALQEAWNLERFTSANVQQAFTSRSHS